MQFHLRLTSSGDGFFQQNPSRRGSLSSVSEELCRQSCTKYTGSVSDCMGRTSTNYSVWYCNWHL